MKDRISKKPTPRFGLNENVAELREIGASSIFPIHSEDRLLPKILRLNEHGPWVCGGAVLQWYQGKPVDIFTDVDVFLTGEKQFVELYQRLKAGDKHYEAFVQHDSKNAMTFSVNVKSPEKKRGPMGWLNEDKSVFKYRVQLIRKNYYDNIGDVLKNFDLSVCKIGTDGQKYYFADGAARDIRTRTLNYDGDLREASYMRILKYETYGYRPSKELQQKMREQFDLCTDLANYSNLDEYELGL